MRKLKSEYLKVPQVVNVAKDLRAKGWCLIGIVRELERRGLRGPRGKHIDKKGVKRMLSE